MQTKTNIKILSDFDPELSGGKYFSENSYPMYVPKGQFPENQSRLLEYAFKDDCQFESIYSPDARTEKYFNAFKPILLNNFTMVGNGLGEENDCGKYRGLKTCPHHPHQKLEPIMKSCNKLACPVCWRKASKRKGNQIADHMKGRADYLFWNGYKYITPAHYSLNVVVTKDQFYEILSSWAMYQNYCKIIIEPVIEEYFLGSVYMCHPFRFVDKDTRKTLHYSLHFHVMGWGYLPRWDKFVEKHGFNYTKLSNLTGLKAIKACASYILTHSLIHQYYIQKEITLSDDVKHTLTILNYKLKKPIKDYKPPNFEYKEQLMTKCAYKYTGILKHWKMEKLSFRKNRDIHKSKRKNSI